MRKGLIIGAIFIVGTIGGYAQQFSERIKPLQYRNIGPFRGGRANAGTGVVGDPMTYYMGTTGGGVWKTIDAGQHWENISDGYFQMGSVGAIAVSESNPNIVYVGMGEHAPRGVMTSHGDGVYKSNDAGRTWVHLGLEKTQHISRIVVHPSNPEILWVAAQGALHGPSIDRGIYKSTDGGKSWKKTLYINTLSGASELSIDILIFFTRPCGNTFENLGRWFPEEWGVACTNQSMVARVGKPYTKGFPMKKEKWRLPFLLPIHKHYLL